MASAGRDRLLAIFDDREALLTALREVRRAGVDTLSAFAPAYDAELVDLTTPAATRTGWWAASGAIAGGLAGLLLTIWTTAQWPTLLLGGKPLISMRPYLLIAAELAMLGAALAAFGVFFRDTLAAGSRAIDAYDPAFSDAAFGLLIQSRQRTADQIVALVRDHGAIAWRFV